MTDAIKKPERQLVSIAHIITRSSEIHPDRVVIDDLYSGRQLTYQELDARITRLASALDLWLRIDAPGAPLTNFRWRSLDGPIH